MISESFSFTLEMMNIQNVVMMVARNLKGEHGLFLTPVLMLWGGGHFDGHVWR